MLTASQCVVVAFVCDGGIICRDCATKKYGEMGIAAIEEGIAEFVPSDVSPMIEYELSSYVGEMASERADEEVGPWSPQNAEEWNTAYESESDFYPCDSCGKDCR